MEVWRLTGYYSGNTSTVIFSDDRVYGVNRDFEDSSLFLGSLAQGNWLREDSDNPTVQAFEKLGASWLMFAKTDYCDAGCLVSAFAVSGASEIAVEATWVVLFENDDIAKQAEEASEEVLDAGEIIAFAADGDWADPSWITDVYTDDAFLVFEASVPIEEAAFLFAALIGGLKHP